tara:strand:- start:3806 stop:4765 length:960 start_codon:yes stop_codon:yes gene_type:complete
MYNTFLKKYKPQKYKDFTIDKEFIDVLKTLISIDTLNILFVGDKSSGKSSLLDATIREYYNLNNIPNNNVLYINNLHEQGISYYRNEVKTFCQTPSSINGKKKIIVIDDIDNINEQSQQVFRNCIDKYSHIVSFIASCNNTQKVVESIQSRCTILKIKPIEISLLKTIFKKIKNIENIEITDDAENFILKISNYSIRILINYLEKLKLYQSKITLDIAKNICTNINFNELEIYTKYLIDNNIHAAIKIIKKLFNTGYSVIDIIDCYYTFIKYTNIIDEDKKYQCIILISFYISRFYTIHEDTIELYFFTWDLKNKLSNK